MLQLDKLFRYQEIFIIFLLSTVQIRILKVKCVYFLQFLVDIFPSLDPDPWIRIFLRIQIQTFFRNQRIRILSNDLKDILVRSTDKCACMLRSCAEVWVISGIVRSYSQDRDLAIVLHLLPEHNTLYIIPFIVLHLLSKHYTLYIIHYTLPSSKFAP